MDHLPLWFQINDGYDYLLRWYARSSASSGMVEVGKGNTGWLWRVFSSDDPLWRLVCTSLVRFAADHLAGFVFV
jgi:hypothetical protein